MWKQKNHCNPSSHQNFCQSPSTVNGVEWHPALSVNSKSCSSNGRAEPTGICRLDRRKTGRGRVRTDADVAVQRRFRRRNGRDRLQECRSGDGMGFMIERTWIKCPGCEGVVDPTRAACPGCGNCLNCGRRRSKTVTQCDTCDVPYCDCCGRCPVCLDLRYSEVGPCECGHPNDEAKLDELVRYNAVVGAETQRMPFGCVIALTGTLVLLGAGILWLFLWLR